MDRETVASEKYLYNGFLYPNNEVIVMTLSNESYKNFSVYLLKEIFPEIDARIQKMANRFMEKNDLEECYITIEKITYKVTFEEVDDK